MLLLVCFVRLAEAQDLGVSLLALPGYTKGQCEIALEVFKGQSLPYLATLWGTFGPGNRCAREFTKRYQNKTHRLHIYLANNTCLRPPRTCGKFDVFRGYNIRTANLKKSSGRILRRFEQAVKGAVSLANDKTKLRLSVGLEDDYTGRAFYRIKKRIRKIYDGEIVRTKNSRRAFAHNYYVELHDWEAKFEPNSKCIWSNDGRDLDLGGNYLPLPGFATLSDFRSRTESYLRSNCDVLLWWNSQGIRVGKFILPYDRNYRISTEDITVVRKLLRSIEK